MTFLPVLARWRERRRRYSQPIATIPSKDKISPDGRCALPMELWTHIFLHLEDDALFVAAAVCRPFNELSIRIILLTNGVASSDMSTGNYNIPSRLLRVLLRALFIPTIKNLLCVFTKSTVSLHLPMVTELVGRSTEISSVDMRFPANAPRAGMLDDSKHRAFCTALTALVSRTPRDIIFVSEWHSLRCSSRDLFSLLGRKSTGKKPSFLPITAITSAKLYFQREMLDNVRPFTMLVLDESTTELPFDRLSVALAGWGSSKNRLSAAQLSAMLPKLTLPHLKTLNIFTPGIDPSMLRDFLIRHPQVEKIGDLRWSSSQQVPLLQLPLALPSLREVRAVTAKNLLSLLIATAPSPPRTICVSFHKRGANGRASPFRYLSHRDIPLELKIDDIRWANSFTQTDFALATSLHCVDAVFVSSRDIEDSTVLFPWLRALPALSTVQIFRWEHLASADDLLFLTKARAILAPPGADIQVEFSSAWRFSERIYLIHSTDIDVHGTYYFPCPYFNLPTWYRCDKLG
ncbi:hypothetical protein MSAN_00601200 [Mycena sanguinolenta]|uniref:F-box domain-containing protein n=1 Tax=Mycena sanguinolenta TaxID=230812 RepID=A0A8H6ZAD9_9AGAR|nr:hypothetical protein MSAN_00601200 [Mycena sanguinolenta]